MDSEKSVKIMYMYLNSKIIGQVSNLKSIGSTFKSRYNLPYYTNIFQESHLVLQSFKAVCKDCPPLFPPQCSWVFSLHGFYSNYPGGGVGEIMVFIYNYFTGGVIGVRQVMKTWTERKILLKICFHAHTKGQRLHSTLNKNMYLEAKKFFFLAEHLR